jgi:hypothetical protein
VKLLFHIWTRRHPEPDDYSNNKTTWCSSPRPQAWFDNSWTNKLLQAKLPLWNLDCRGAATFYAITVQWKEKKSNPELTMGINEKTKFVNNRGQLNQHSTRSFYVRKLHSQLFCAYVLGLYFTGVNLPAQKLRVERWWNWAHDEDGKKNSVKMRR